MHIFIIVDALGWEFLLEMPFLDEIAKEKCRLKTVFGYSSGAIPSILTGQFPSRHGQWNLFYHSPKASPFRVLRHIPFINSGHAFQNKYIRESVRRVCKKLSGYTGTFSLPMIPFEEIGISPVEYFSRFDICEKKWLYAEKSIDGTDILFDALAARRINYGIYTYSRNKDAQIFDRVRDDLCDQKYDFYFLYLCELDHFLHFHRDDPNRIKEKIRWYEDNIREVYAQALKINDKCSLAVCSDHGMAPVRETVDLVTPLSSMNLDFGMDYLAMLDSTMGRFWFFSAIAEKAIRDYLATLDCGTILSDENLRELGICFPDNRYGDLIFALNEGLILHPGMMGSWRPKGMHGYLPDCPSSDAFFLCNWEMNETPKTLTDILPCILGRLGN